MQDYSVDRVQEPALSSSAGSSSKEWLLNISTRYSVGRNAEGCPCLAITVSADDFTRLTAQLPANELGPTTSICLLNAVRNLIAASEMRLNETQRARLTRALNGHGRGQSDRFSDHERLTFRQVLRFCGRTGANTLLATTLAVTVTDGSSRSVHGVVQSSQLLNIWRSKIDAALAKGPAPQYQRRWPKRLEMAEAVLIRANRLFELRAQGLSHAALVRELKMNVHTMSAWLRGETPRSITLLASLTQPSRSCRLSIFNQRTESEPLAVLLGAYQATTPRKGILRLVQFVSPDQDTAQMIAQTCHKVGIAREARIVAVTPGGYARYRFTINSSLLSRSLQEVTDQNNRIPWEMLGTEGERIAYLRGYFAFAGTARDSYYDVRSFNFPDRIIGIAALLQGLGIASVVHKNDQRFDLEIKESVAVARLCELAVLPEFKRVPLQQALAQRKPGPNWSIQYQAAMDYHQRYPKASIAEIASQRGVSSRMVRAWIKEGVVPFPVQAERELEKLKVLRKIPDPSFAAYLYRQRRISRVNAIAIAQEINAREFAVAVEFFHNLRVEISTLPADVIVRAARPPLLRG